jgi:hypothetical protein
MKDDTIFTNLSKKYNVPKYAVREVIMRYYEAILNCVTDHDLQNGILKTACVTPIGKFGMRKFTATKILLNRKFKYMKETYGNKDGYDIVVQGDGHTYVENNEPFFFMVKDKDVELKEGDIVALKAKAIGLGQRTPYALVEAEILEARKPFYKAAFFLEKEPIDAPPVGDLVLKRENFEKLYLK